MTISKKTIDVILDRADIVDVISPHVELKKAGANFMGLCPFHGEKSPSFTVSQTKQFYHCFGCGKSGDSIKFMEEHLGYSFPDAVNELAKQYGVVVDNEGTPEDKVRREKHQAAARVTVSLNDRAQQYFSQWLSQGDASADARAYLKKRKVDDKMVQLFGLGYAKPAHALRDLALQKGRCDPLVEAGLLVRDADDPAVIRDRFRHRLMFPIYDARGSLVGFGGRALEPDQKPKYLNSPETPAFEKGKILYGLNLAQKDIQQKKCAWVVEGYMDVITMHQFGICNAVAALGTAFSEDHAKQLTRLASEINFFFDADGAGAKAAWRTLVNMLPFCKDGLVCRFVRLDAAQGKDVDEFLHGGGTPEQLLEKAKQSPTLGQYIFIVLDQQIAVDTPEGKARYEKEVKDLISKLPPVSGLRKQLYQMLDQKLGRARTSSDRVAFFSEQDQIRQGSERVRAMLNPGARSPFQRRTSPYGQTSAPSMPVPSTLAADSLVHELVAALIAAPHAALANATQLHHYLGKLPGLGGVSAAHRCLDVYENEGLPEGCADSPDSPEGVDLIQRWPIMAEEYLRQAARKDLMEKLRRGDISQEEYVSSFSG